MWYIRFADACGSTHSPRAPSIGSLGPWTLPLHVRTSYKYCVRFADAYGPTNSPRAPSIGSRGPWTPPLLAGLFGPRDEPPSMYVRFMNAVRAFLMPVAQLTVRARRL
jgi:hypothetical protein